MIILGIDPGLATIGWGVISSDGSKHRAVAYGSVITEAGLTTEKRLSQIYSDLGEIIRTYRPDAVAVEELFFNTNITTGIRVAEARGVILLSAFNHGVKVYEYTPLQAKQSVVGYGRAEKRQVIAMVTRLLNLEKPPKPDDTADALAIAICHAHSGASKIAAYYNN
ncbi:MAG: crossover junction endodeoxyribonuclease RuvC [Clostridia bacterium]|nr:crossover junction endodeoxyribonuclease RuvC [Clostridia bacterium]